jgi:DDE superfamily endonuclease
MAHPTIPAPCPHCGREPGIRVVLTVIMQTLRAMAFDQVLTGWRWLALCSAVAGLLLVQHGASAARVARAIPGVSHDQLTRLLGERDLATCRMTALRHLARSFGPAAWIIDDVIVPKPAMRTLAWAKGLWCPAEKRYVHALNIVVLLACWGPLRIPLGFRLWCPKECVRGYAPGYSYRTKLLLARDLIAEAWDDGLRCQYVTFDAWYTARPVTSFLDAQGITWYGAIGANHVVVLHGQRLRVDALGRHMHDGTARRIDRVVAGADISSPRLGHVRLTRVRIHQPKRPYLYLVTNQRDCTPSQAWACKVSRWPIEPMFRDEKQLLDLAGCQSPRVEAQETHIALVLVAWVVLQRLRQAPSQTTGEVQAELIATVWGHETRFSSPVSDSMRNASVRQGVQMP